MKLKLFLFNLLVLLSLISEGQIRYFYATLQGSQEVPPNASAASGIVVARYDLGSHSLLLYGDYQNLTAEITGAHIHGIAPPGQNAGVLFPLEHTGGTSGALTAGVTLSVNQETELLDGNMYVNVHNATYPGGEIRGQLIRTTTGQTEFLNSRIQSSQEVPPNPSEASGTSTLLIDKATKMAYLTGSFRGLTSAATAAHIHIAPPGVAGPVIITLAHTAAQSGSIHVASAVTDAQIASILEGDAYVNIHTATYPGGEIRGQLNLYTRFRFFKTLLNSSQEVPPNPSPAIGTVIVKYDTETKMLELVGDYQNTTSAVTAAHIHGPAPVGANAGVLFPLTTTGGTSGVLTGTATISLIQEAELFDRRMYVNVHTANYPGGEIRGQLTVTSAGQTQYLTGNLQGEQEVPPNASPATGMVTVLLDRSTTEVYLTGNFSGLTTNATAAHIHRGQAGVAGPVVVPLNVTMATAGTVNGYAVVSSSFVDSMLLGFSYVNIHNATYPGGEIRAQLGNQVLPIKLSYFNAFKDRNNVSLVWESAQEIDMKQYEVEQQDPVTKQWVTKSIVSAKGGNNNTRYQMNDAPIASTEPFVIYRLKMLDKNGSYTYSQVIRLNYRISKAELTILTNPVVNNSIRYNITGLAGDKKAEVSVIDFNGRIVRKTVASSIRMNTIDLGSLSRGMYKLIVLVDGIVLQQTFTK